MNEDEDRKPKDKLEEIIIQALREEHLKDMLKAEEAKIQRRHKLIKRIAVLSVIAIILTLIIINIWK